MPDRRWAPKAAPETVRLKPEWLLDRAKLPKLLEALEGLFGEIAEDKSL